MSQMKELYEKVSKDVELQEQFSQIVKEAEQAGEQATGEKLLAFAKGAGYDVTLEEMREFLQALIEKQPGELSEIELDMVAGGKATMDDVVKGAQGVAQWAAVSIATLGIMCIIMAIDLTTRQPS